MTTQTVRFFVGRNQKIFGPLSTDEIEALKKSGQLSAYSWICKEGDAEWTPIDLPPALPTASAPTLVPETTPHSVRTLTPVPPPQPSFASIDPHTFRVILFDRRNVISGWLIGVSEKGCEIRSDQNGPDPMFVAKESACLNLHNTRTGETVKLNVRLGPVSREGKKWSYRMRWNALPDLLA